MATGATLPQAGKTQQVGHAADRESAAQIGERTVIGNRIDDRLALGIARTMLTRVDAQRRAARMPDGQTLHVASRSERIRSLQAIGRSFGPLFIGIVPRKNYWQADMATYSTRRGRPGAPICGLSVMTWSIDLRSGTFERPKDTTLRWPFSGVQMIATVDIHAIARIIQRSPRRSQAEIFGLLRDAACWSRVALAESGNDGGSWMMPTGDGLLCAMTEKVGDEAVPGCVDLVGRQVVVIKTFVDRSRFRTQSSGAWKRLVDCGGLEDPPRLLEATPLSDRHRQLWRIMRDEGRGWDIRRQHAELRHAAPSGSDMRDRGEVRTNAEDEVDLDLESDADASGDSPCTEDTDVMEMDHG